MKTSRIIAFLIVVFALCNANTTYAQEEESTDSAFFIAYDSTDRQDGLPRIILKSRKFNF